MYPAELQLVEELPLESRGFPASLSRPSLLMPRAGDGGADGGQWGMVAGSHNRNELVMIRAGPVQGKQQAKGVSRQQVYQICVNTKGVLANGSVCCLQRVCLPGLPPLQTNARKGTSDVLMSPVQDQIQDFERCPPSSGR